MARLVTLVGLIQLFVAEVHHISSLLLLLSLLPLLLPPMFPLALFLQRMPNKTLAEALREQSLDGFL
jgi:hypothetical protein